ncbi:MAG: hypothetical protein NVV63_04495 [Opitutus sp.]|nr:hypothetical protein [Opitutus sp.]
MSKIAIGSLAALSISTVEESFCGSDCARKMEKNRRGVGRRDDHRQEQRQLHRPTQPPTQRRKRDGCRQQHAPRRQAARGQRDRAEVRALRHETAVEKDEHQREIRGLVGQHHVVEMPELQHIAAAHDARAERDEDHRHAPSFERDRGDDDGDQQGREDQIESQHSTRAQK